MAVNSAVGAFDAVIVRLVAQEVHPFGIVFFRNLFSLLFLAFFLRRIGPNPFRSSMWPVHCLRAVMKLAALVAYFYAVTLLPLSVAIAVAFTTPLFVSLGSLLFLGERPRPLRLLALAAGFGGVWIVLRPDTVPVGTGAFLALGAAVGLAGVALLMKVSSSREPALRIVLFNLLVTVPVAFLLCLPVWTTPSIGSLLLLAVQGAGGLAAQFAFARAMKLADASLLILVDFIRLPLAVFLGLALFGEPVEVEVFIGGGVILASLLLLLRQERKAARQGP
ncbi:DMT family transporter (plasmid) [Skermanella mucosa]|uniref:DMT family transporter n=1 Tax=Skermanella mucosa TaxID=1789672 RepID=UPI001E47F50D|nr:EamA family transporter [Skermanella mucosa]UEM24741.1 DMT family transporter [Skermanella mucosa]